MKTVSTIARNFIHFFPPQPDTNCGNMSVIFLDVRKKKRIVIRGRIQIVTLTEMFCSSNRISTRQCSIVLKTKFQTISIYERVFSSFSLIHCCFEIYQNNLNFLKISITFLSEKTDEIVATPELISSFLNFSILHH